MPSGIARGHIVRVKAALRHQDSVSALFLYSASESGWRAVIVPCNKRAMAHHSQNATWRERLAWLASELFIIFLAVSAAFVVENYRDHRTQLAEFHDAMSGVIAELRNTEAKTRTYSDAIFAELARWEEADRDGRRAVPGHYRIPGATHPPTAAWNSAVSSGVARMIEPKLRTDLGYYYSEFLGIHDNYDRYNQFTEREVLPRILLGPDAFYGADGKLLPQFRVYMDLQKEFATDLRQIGASAHELRTRLEASQR